MTDVTVHNSYCQSNFIHLNTSCFCRNSNQLHRPYGKLAPVLVEKAGEKLPLGSNLIKVNIL